ncbi:AraC family transcriptional regulator [Halodesulfovibrio aestuarii]|uniref:AraC family transcriptional regulator n=1 Tax=Halodesulfovibrio aestuarii TaxID=126333 RepID=UPI003D3278CF
MAKEKSEIRTINLSEELGIEAIFGKRIRNTFQRHIHATYLFGLVEKGTRDITCGGCTESVSEQESFVLQPAQVHTCTCSADHCYSILSIKPEFVEALAVQLFGIGHPPPFFPYVCCRDKLLSKQLQAIFTLIKKQGMSDHALASIQRYISTLLQHQPPIPHKTTQQDESVIDSTCEFLQKNHAQKLPLSSLAEHACLSPFHLQRLFTKRMGISPNDYLQAHRVAEARQRLRMNIPLSELALSLGFYDQSHFTRTFRKVMGVSPGSYRKTNSN